jgi:hypothetical protein
LLPPQWKDHESGSSVSLTESNMCVRAGILAFVIALLTKIDRGRYELHVRTEWEA